MPTKPATTRMIAERCGFGQSTVSMALRNDPCIPKRSRAIILAAAAQMGYRPDPHFARMMAAVKPTIRA